MDQAKNTGDLHPYLRSVNIRWDEVDLSDINQMRFEPEEIDRYTITKGDLLICEGGDVGRSAIIRSFSFLRNVIPRILSRPSHSQLAIFDHLAKESGSGGHAHADHLLDIRSRDRL